jgi:hypothetical protein
MLVMGAVQSFQLKINTLLIQERALHPVQNPEVLVPGQRLVVPQERELPEPSLESQRHS